MNKNPASPFNSTGIDHYLRNMALETLVIVGLATGACVMSTTRGAADRGYNCILVEDACATIDPVSHESEPLDVKS